MSGSGWSEQHYSGERLKHGYAVVALVAMAFVAYWRGASVSMIFGDEWGRIGQIAFGTASCPDPVNILMRPLLGCYPMLLHSFAGLNVSVYHQVSFFLNLVEVILLYFVLCRVLPRRRLYNLIVSMLYLIYPTVFCRLFFERGTYHIANILFLGSLLVLIKFYHGRNWWFFVASVFLILLSLLLDEAHIGMIAVTSCLFVVRSGGQSLRRRVAYGSLALLAGFFSFARWLAQLQAGNMFGHRTGSVALTPMVLLPRLVLGFRISLQWGWTNILHVFIPYHKDPSAVIGGILVVACTIFLLAVLRRSRLGKAHDQRRGTHVPLTWKDHLVVAAGGMGLLAAGYFPMILAFSPSLTYLGSRINLLPSIGAAIVIGVVISALARLLSPASVVPLVFVLLSVPLVLLGIAAQHNAQRCSEVGWATQKSIWQQMFSIAPDIRPGTVVVLLLPEYEGCSTGANPLESGPWGFSSALSVLYGHDDLSGCFAYTDRESFLTGDSESVLPGMTLLENRTLLFEYDQKTDELSLACGAATDDALSNGASSTILCPGCVLSHPPEGVEWRDLVTER